VEAGSLNREPDEARTGMLAEVPVRACVVKRTICNKKEILWIEGSGEKKATLCAEKELG
jgi:hypothetical protein